jgi:anti-anti-sigma factor
VTALKPQNPSNRCRLTLTGEIDVANAENYLAVAQAIIAGYKTDPRFTIDLSDITFIDCMGLGMLVAIRNAATDARMELRLDGPPACVRRLLEISALDHHFGVADGRKPSAYS